MEIREHNGPIGGRMHFPKEGNLLRSQHRAVSRRFFATFAMLPLLALAACDRNNNTPPTARAIRIGLPSASQGELGPGSNRHPGEPLAQLAPPDPRTPT